MKKKILASLLAVAMMASLVVPAFADNFQPSSQSGDVGDITALEFSKDSVTTPNQSDKQVNLADYLTAYAGNDKIVQDLSTLEWSINDNLSIGLDDTGRAYAVEDSGSAVVTVKVPGKDISASIKVVATKGIDPKPAQGYKFDKTSYMASTELTSTGVAVETNGQVKMAIVPLSDQYAFNTTCYGEIKTALESKGDNRPVMKIGSKEIAGSVTVADVPANWKGDKIEFTFKPATPSEMRTEQSTLTGTFKIPKMEITNTSTNKKVTVPERSVRVDVKKSIPGVKIIRTASVKIEVGQTADLRDCFAITTGANYNTDVSYMLDFYNDSSTAADYAVQSDNDAHPWLIQGIAVGKEKAIVTLNEAQTSTTIPIEVVPRGTLAKPETGTMSISATSGALKVGETMQINAKGVGADQEVSWTPSNNNITVTMKTTGEGPATITGKAAGSTLLFARVNGEIIGTATITVTKDGVTPSTPAGTPNPSTGDSFFANLF